MYILGSLLILRLFQSRHPDINSHAHKAFLMFAVIIILAVFGVVSWSCFERVSMFILIFLLMQIQFQRQPGSLAAILM